MTRALGFALLLAAITAGCDTTLDRSSSPSEGIDRSVLPSLGAYFAFTQDAGKRGAFACAAAIRLEGGKILTRVKPIRVPDVYAGVSGTRRVLYSLTDQEGTVLRMAECVIPDSEAAQTWLVEHSLRLPPALRATTARNAAKAAETGLICVWDPDFNGYVCEDQIVIYPDPDGDLLGDPDMPGWEEWPYYEYPSTGGGGGGGVSGSDGWSGLPTPVGEDKITNELGECLAPVFSSVAYGGTAIASLINNFAGGVNTPEWNLRIQEGSVPGTGSTSWDSDTKTAVVTVNWTGNNGMTRLSLMRTIMHESVHAYLLAYQQMKRVQFVSDFASMLVFYRSLRESEVPEEQWTQTAHHREIALAYRDHIASSLQVLGQSLGINRSSQFYQDMAWAGLQDTPAWSDGILLTSADRTRISAVLNAELTGKTIGGHAPSGPGIVCD